MPMKVSLRQIDGPWTAGYVLDKHMLNSVYLGDDAQGHPQFQNTRTEAGEALFQLKYRFEPSHAGPLAQAVLDHICPRLPPIGFVVPMPPSRARPWQPVAVVARELSRRLGVPTFERLLMKSPLARPLKDMDSREEKLHALAGAFFLQDEIRAQGCWNALLLDDLFDSGASMEAASIALAGYAKVHQVCVAALTWK